MKKTLVFAVKALVSVALLAVLYRKIDLAAVAGRLRDLRPGPMAAVFVLLAFNTFISSVKWRLFLRADGRDAPLRTLFSSYYIASFFGVFLPSTIGGDAFRIYDVSRLGVPPAAAAASVFADRLTGFLALAVLGVLAPLAGARVLAGSPLLLVPLAVLGGLAALAWSVLHPTFARRAMAALRLDRVGKLARFADRFLDTMAAYRRSPGALARGMAISFAFQGAVILAVYALARALRIEVPFAYFLVFVPVVSLLEALPVSVYGVGIRDTGYALCFLRAGQPAEQAGALAILYVAATLVYVSFGGVLFALRGRRLPPAAAREAAS